MIGPGVFEGVRVLELAQYVFVPAAGSLLADFGAEVIKVEMTGDGDPYRTLSMGDGRETAEVNIALEQNNRNKKSIGIDAKTAEGREVLRKLVETADVFVTSVRPQAIRRLDLDYETIRSWNPRIIYVRGNGFGFKGPEANRPGYDATAFWTRGGFASVLMHADHERPVRPRPAFGDHTGALAVAFGIAAALFRREKHGEPSLVEASLLATGMWVLSQDITAAQDDNYDALAGERRAPLFPLHQAFSTKDGRWIQLTLLHPDRYWAAFCDTLGIPELRDDPRFTTTPARTENGVECTELIRAAFARQTWAELKPRFDDFDAPWELVSTIKEMLTDPQAVANGYVVEAQMSNGTSRKLVSGPVMFDGVVPTEYRRCPKFGENTDDLLGDLGLGADQIAALRREGVVQ